MNEGARAMKSRLLSAALAAWLALSPIAAEANNRHGGGVGVWHGGGWGWHGAPAWGWRGGWGWHGGGCWGCGWAIAGGILAGTALAAGALAYPWYYPPPAYYAPPPVYYSPAPAWYPQHWMYQGQYGQ